MKREIEFRGKTAKGEWVYGDLLNLHNGDKYIVNNKFGACIDDKGNFINTESPFVCKVIPETVGQYVGIKDKTSKKVYEGDILKVDRELELWCNQTKHETFYGVVEYDEENTRFVTNGKTYKNMSIFIQYNISYEVIGTIFDKESDNGD